ncbi:MAG: type I-E CRISPR-associated protein Cse2/CasB [Anaerolineae bacterium]|nr:type I-E CRISPR-associated protein Cse2/CasB [Anaerolineae bacterium]
MSEPTNPPQVQLFMDRLSQLEPGERARLKRNAGHPLAEAGKVLGLFYRLLPLGVSEREYETYFLAATLYPMAEGGGAGNLGASLRRAQSKANKKGLDRRVEILLDADRAQLPFRLRQAIHFLQSNRVKVNWPLLLSDLLWWSAPGRNVQQRWARSYFAESQDQSKKGA